MGDKEKIESPSMVEIHAYEGKDLPYQYLNLVRSRWKRTYRHGNDYMKLVYAAAYYQAYSVYVAQILGRRHTVVRLAVLEDDPDVVLGFSVIENNILHYVEVQRSCRRQGLGTNLVPEKIDWFTHLTKTGMKIWSVKMPDAHFNPYA